jgi:FkbM family methyltransferase
VFDVGAFNGDFAKLGISIWPGAQVVCFEALPQKIKALEVMGNTSNILVVNGLIGERNDDYVKFHQAESASSVLEESSPNDFQTNYYKMRTLDACIEEFNLPKPQLLKIDTQGYEYNVLSGFQKNISSCEVILAELNFIDIHKNVKLAHDVIEFLKKHGFVIFDICQLHRKPSDKVLWQADFIFVKENSVLRSNKIW